MVSLVAVLFLSLYLKEFRRPISDDDTRVATSEIARWVLGGDSPRGNKQPVMELRFFRETTIVLSFVNCPVPEDAADLVPNRKIQIVDDYRPVYEEYGYEGYFYIVVHQQSRSDDCIHYEVTVGFGSLGGQGYEFVVTKGVLGLHYAGDQTWVS